VIAQTNGSAQPRPEGYEPPRLEVLGSVKDLTADFCIWGKSLGQPDYFQHIPIANCSA